MGLLSMLFGAMDINKGVDEARSTEGAVIIDVRNRDEFAGGHIPGAVNVPAGEISQIAKICEAAADFGTPLYVHCLTGRRSSAAVKALRNAGYTNVKNIGGINNYRGPVEQ